MTDENRSEAGASGVGSFESGRRELLATTGLTVTGFVGGCLGSDDGDGDDGNSDGDEPETTDRADDTDDGDESDGTDGTGDGDGDGDGESDDTGATDDGAGDDEPDETADESDDTDGDSDGTDGDDGDDDTDGGGGDGGDDDADVVTDPDDRDEPLPWYSMDEHSYVGTEIEYEDPMGSVGRNAVDDLEIIGWVSAIGEGEAQDWMDVEDTFQVQLSAKNTGDETITFSEYAIRITAYDAGGEERPFSLSSGEYLDSEIPPGESGGYFTELSGNVDPATVDSYEIVLERE